MKGITPFCHTIKVVISPKGENAPPALAATTILIQAKQMNFLLPFATAITTAHINSAVVKLSAIGDIKKESTPVMIKIFLKSKPIFTNQALKTSNTFLSVMVLIKVIATNKNINNSANSRKTCLKVKFISL